MPVRISSTLNNDPLKDVLAAEQRERREAARDAAEQQMRTPQPRNDLLPALEYVHLSLRDLRLPRRQVRKLEQRDVEELANTIRHFGFSAPILVGRDGSVVNGVARVEAARLLGLDKVPAIRVDHLTPDEEQALRLAMNRLGAKRPYDLPELRLEFETLLAANQPIHLLGFSKPEIDMVLSCEVKTARESDAKLAEGTPVTRAGDIWLMGDHVLVCGDATKAETFDTLLGMERPQLVLTDAPYNVEIASIVSTEHREFAQASGEMSDEEFDAFLRSFLHHCMRHLVDGGVVLAFMDWKHIEQLLAAGRLEGFELLNLIVWMKTQGGMGSMWRSQHELVAAFKKKGKHKNNVSLGRNGRDRTNCWVVPGANTLGSQARELLKDHPTPKPVMLLADAILDVTDRGDIVLDCFAGSGSTLIACEQTGRVGRMIEIDERYCDLIIRRWQAETGGKATLADTGEAFDALAESGRCELLETLDAPR